jgi:hypothetical protein
MAIGWISVLKMVPWQDVISNAPKVVEGARQLWKTVARAPQPAATPGPAPSARDGKAAEAAAVTRQEFEALGLAVAELHQQMAESSGLIRELADQNAQLIRQVEQGRVWLRRLALGLAALCAWLLLRSG